MRSLDSKVFVLFLFLLIEYRGRSSCSVSKRFVVLFYKVFSLV